MIYNMQTILELHQKHFMSAIKKAAKQVVLTHILLGSKHNMNAEGLQKYVMIGFFCVIDQSSSQGTQNVVQNSL